MHGNTGVSRARSSGSSTPHERMRCPTCRAVQEPSPECRRCKCNLSLLIATLDHQRALHRAVLRELRERRYAAALELARRRWTLSPDATAARLLSVCHLVRGHFQAALAACESSRLGDGPE